MHFVIHGQRNGKHLPNWNFIPQINKPSKPNFNKYQNIPSLFRKTIIYKQSELIQKLENSCSPNILVLLLLFKPSAFDGCIYPTIFRVFHRFAWEKRNFGESSGRKVMLYARICWESMSQSIAVYLLKPGAEKHETFRTTGALRFKEFTIAEVYFL